MSVSMVMSMAMSMTVIVPVSMTMMVMSAGCVHSPEIDCESNRRNEQKLLRLHFGRIHPIY